MSGRGAPRGNTRALKHGCYTAERRALMARVHTLIRAARATLNARSYAVMLVRVAALARQADAEMLAPRGDGLAMRAERVAVRRPHDNGAERAVVLALGRQH